MKYLSSSKNKKILYKIYYDGLVTLEIRQFLTKLSIHLQCELPTPLLATYPREMKTSSHTKICKWVLTTVFFTINQTENKTKQNSKLLCLPDKQIITGQTVQPRNVMLLSNGKKLSTHTVWINLKWITLCEHVQTQRAACHMIPSTQHLRKGRTLGIENWPVVARVVCKGAAEASVWSWWTGSVSWSQ